MENRNLKFIDDEKCTVNGLLLNLNDDCLLKIFEYLGWEDTRSLGQICCCLRNLAQMRYRNIDFRIRSTMKNIDSILKDVGYHIRSLTIDFSQGFGGVKWDENVFRIVRQHCTELKSLKLIDWWPESCQNQDSADFFCGIEKLTLIKCYLHMDSANPHEFFGHFHKLKVLNFSLCNFRSNDLKLLFENNPEIESFYLNGGDVLGGGFNNNDNDFRTSDFELFQFGPKFKKLGLTAKCEILQMDSLLRLTTLNLTKLRLASFSSNLNNFLNELAGKGILEELELTSVDLDRDAFDIIRLFEKLQLLVLESGESQFVLDSTCVWPPKLKHLRYSSAITIDGFISTIKQLKNLEDFDLFNCRITNSSRGNFKNVTKMSMDILKLRDNQQLLVILPHSCGIIKDENIKYLVDTDHLKIFNNFYFTKCYQSPIKIDFPDIVD